MKIQPRGEWLVVEPIDFAKAGTLWVPDNAVASYKQGKIIAVPAVETENTKGLTPGSVVVYDRVGAVEFRMGSHTFVMLKAREILGEVKED